MSRGHSIKMVLFSPGPWAAGDRDPLRPGVGGGRAGGAAAARSFDFPAREAETMDHHPGAAQVGNMLRSERQGRCVRAMLAG